MATKFLSATASASVAVWWTTSGGTTTTTAPGVGDDANLNGNTLTVDQTFTCDNIIGTTGTLAVSGNRTINANIGNSSAGFSCTLNGASQTVTLNGNIVAGVTANKITVSGASTTLNMTGNVTGSNGGNVRGISQSAGTVTVTGSVTGGTASGAFGIVQTGGTLTVTGSLVDAAVVGAISKSAGTFNYTPTSAQTAMIGGATLYPAAANTDPGIANVKSGTGYTFQGASQTGTYASPVLARDMTGGFQ